MNATREQYSVYVKRPPRVQLHYIQSETIQARVNQCTLLKSSSVFINWNKNYQHLLHKNYWHVILQWGCLIPVAYEINELKEENYLIFSPELNFSLLWRH